MAYGMTCGSLSLFWSLSKKTRIRLSIELSIGPVMFVGTSTAISYERAMGLSPDFDWGRCEGGGSSGSRGPSLHRPGGLI
jgi:hypothetical protein